MSRPRKHLRRAGPALVLLLGLAALAVPLGCSKGSGGSDKGKGPPGKGDISFPVEVAAVAARTIDYAITAVGSVDAFEELQLTARVAGVLERVRFREGDTVKKGDVLAEIEPGRFDLAVRSTRATLDRAQAVRDDAARLLARRERMSAEGLSSQEEVETVRTRLATSSAEIAQARAALDLAELNLRDAYVRTPVDGVIQTRKVVTGQYVQPGTVLATLVQRYPLLLRFKVTEYEAHELARDMPVHFAARGIGAAQKARILNVAASGDERTRMVDVLAEVVEPDELLRPGAFAEVTVTVGSKRDVPVVPETAVRPSERGFLCYVVEEGVAHERVLTLGMRTADGLIEVRSGLRTGEQLVVRGGEALREGASVRVPGAGSAASGAFDPPATPRASGATAVEVESPRPSGAPSEPSAASAAASQASSAGAAGRASAKGEP
ncbi:MAG: efflux RND transporter periplasmic adaptor subunit [Polyangiaceae bacterium]|nr:efflux RND transporter periplasmic adaptor subunit [Polyangiaceae bacterium]